MLFCVILRDFALWTLWTGCSFVDDWLPAWHIGQSKAHLLHSLPVHRRRARLRTPAHACAVDLWTCDVLKDWPCLALGHFQLFGGSLVQLICTFSF